MAKKKKTKRGTAKAAATNTANADNSASERATAVASTAAKVGPKDRSNWLAVVVGMCAIGASLALYLTYNKVTGAAAALCGSGGGCDLVQHSHWSTLFGVPLAFWGVCTYVLIGGLSWMARSRAKWWSYALFVALTGVAISVYLTIIGLVELDTTCPYCLASLGLLVAIFATLWWARPNRPETADFNFAVWLPSSGLIVACLVAFLHMQWSGTFDPGTGPEREPLKSIAQHLNDSGAKFYGASWCPACTRQKELFAASSHRLPFVECTPNGRGTPLSAECRRAGVQNFPTWTVGKQKFVGVQSPERLATLSDFAPGKTQ